MTWMFVDDYPDEAQALADALAVGEHAITVEVKSPDTARRLLLGERNAPAGVLMDVDFSNAQGERGSGPGLAQDLRVKQRAKEIAEYPIVRFAGRAPVKRNVNGDPGSDDLFDLKVLKEDLGDPASEVQMHLLGLEQVYTELANFDPTDEKTVAQVFGLSEAAPERWSHQGMHDRVRSALQVATHVAAGAIMRGFLTPTGLLLDETVLGYRLGIERGSSGAAWKEVVDALPFKYQGLGSEYFPRWWSRGLEEWWSDEISPDSALVGLTIKERHAPLNARFPGLVPLQMPAGSAGQRPWRVCTLSLEADFSEEIPVDPSEAVRITSRDDHPIWTDPEYASLKVALQKRDDLRLNRADLDRLTRKHQGS